jgi:hypothetical protein
MPDKEMVLELGVEGGGAAIFRTPLASGGWQFHVEGSSIYLDENDDEAWRRWSSCADFFLGREALLQKVVLRTGFKCGRLPPRRRPRLN